MIWLLASPLLYPLVCFIAAVSPELRWGKCEQRLHPTTLARHGYEKARRIGMMAMVGGKDKTKIRNTTPDEFRDLLLSMVRASSSVTRPHRGGDK